MFPGSFNCVSIYADTTEYWTNLTWALNPLLFKINFTGNATNCDSVTLTASGGTQYYWNGGAHPDSTTNTFFNSGTYTVTASNPDGCQVTATEAVTVNRPASTLDASVCEGQSYLGHSIEGTFVDTLISAAGCDSLRTLHLSIVTPPQPNLGESQMVCTGDTLLISPGKFDAYSWQDGSTGDEFAVTRAGTYSVTVTNICGSKQAETGITEQTCIINFPNAFTPNHDGKNDQFKILNAYNLAGYHLTIYNRWGQMVFESADYSKGWDGKFNGADQDQGVYVFFCEYNKSGIHKEFRGTVTLLR
jgi:gliding motility-associated-like protein